MLKKLIVFFFFSFIGIATATPLKPYVFNNDYRHLSEYYQFIEDCSTLSTQQVLQKFNSGAFKSQKPNTPFNSGISTCSYWLVVNVLNQTDLKQKFLWSFYNNGLSFELYELNAGKLIFKNKASMHLALADRPYPVRSVSFPFYLEENQSTTLFIKVTPTTNKNVYFPTDITTPEDYLTYEVEYSYLMGKYFGILLFALFVNLCMFIIIRERIYLFTIFYVFCIILFQLSDFHFDSFEIPSAIFRIWSYINKDFYIGLSIFFYAKIFQIFVDLEKHYATLNQYFNYLNLILLSCALLLTAPTFLPSIKNFPNQQIDLLLNILVFIVISTMFFLTILGIKERKKYFLQFGISFFFLLYGFISYMLNNFNFYHLPIFKPGNILNGSVIEVSLLTILFVYKFKIEKEQAAQKIIAETKKNYKLSKKMLTIEAEEQERFSRNVHDEIGSDITGLRLQLENHLMKSNIEHNQQDVILENVKLLYDKVRNFSYFLKPEILHNNFIQTIENQISFYKNNVKNIEFELFTNIDKSQLFDKNVQMQIIRIIKEVYTNALKHAVASKISMQIIYECKTLMVTIEDNGIGFKPENKTYGTGLENMMARVDFLEGKITIDSNSKGTSIIIEIPVK